MGTLATTERLVIRDLTLDDAAHIKLLNTDPEVLRYVHDEPFADLAAAQKWITEIPGKLPNGFGSITEIRGKNLRKPFYARKTTGKDVAGKLRLVSSETPLVLQGQRMGISFGI